MQYGILEKKDFNSFIAILAQNNKVAAPIAKGFNNYAFEEVKDSSKIALNYIPTILPPKKYFMPKHENILKYDTSKGQDMEAIVEYGKVVLFGIHTCDLAGIQCLNIVFSDRPKDYNYLIRKNKILIIGLECNDYCDEHASCTLVDNHMPNGGYDLFFTDLGDYFIIHINTKGGEDIIENTKLFKKAENSHLRALATMRKKKREIFKNEVAIEPENISPLFDKSYDANTWEDLNNKCISCGNCTNVCPTCYCFDVIDDVNLDLKTGLRYRKWDSCQVEPFASVSGGENFRKKRSDRQRHRYYRKFKYPVDRYSRFFCTGCGRCTRTCMAKISLKETLDSLIKENKKR